MDVAAFSSKYHGDTACTYDEQRHQSPGWQHEQATVERILATLPHCARILDAPVGTGRFLRTYERLGLRATGLDVSTSMLAEARKKSPRADLREGSVFELPFDDDSFDAAVCMRFANWIPLPAFQRAIGELARTSQLIVCNVMAYAPARELGAARLVMQLKWRLFTHRTGDGMHYHRQTDVAAAFSATGLRIREAIDGPHGKKWKHGVPMTTYVLERA